MTKNVRRIIQYPFTIAVTLGATSLLHGAAIPEDVKAHVRERVDKGFVVGLAVGVVDAGGTAFFAHGVTRAQGSPVDERTMFEIGSITKVFTASLLACEVQEGKLDAGKAVAALLPDTVHVPARGDKVITLRDLAAHRSGLPRLPSNLNLTNIQNPYADYNVERLYEFLNGYTLTRDTGSVYEYSNLGMGLLGHALSRAANQSYEQLVIERIAKPLGMTDTRMVLSEEQTGRLARGHAGRQEVKNWHFDCLAGCGGLRSSVQDMTRFMAANLGLMAPELSAAFKRCRSERFDASRPGDQVSVAWGWHITKNNDTETIWHNGQTGGYHSFCGFVPEKKLGVVVLTNSAEDIDDIGFHLLEPRTPLMPVREGGSVSESVLDAYVGRYELAPGIGFDVTKEGTQLFAQLTGQNRFPVFPESETKFFYKVVNAQLTFVKGAEGKATALILHQAGRDQTAKRIP